MSSLYEWVERSVAFLATMAGLGVLSFFAMRLLA